MKLSDFLRRFDGFPSPWCTLYTLSPQTWRKTIGNRYRICASKPLKYVNAKIPRTASYRKSIALLQKKRCSASGWKMYIHPLTQI